MINTVREFWEWLCPSVRRDTGRDRLVLPPPKPTHSWEIYRDRGKEWRWRITASNGERIAASCEGYSSKRSAEENLQRVTRLKIRP